MKSILSLLILYLSFLQATAQIISRDISHVSLDFADGKILVRYDLQLKKNMPDCSIDMLFIDEHFNSFMPVTVTGQTGPGITSGKNKEIFWDFNKDKNLIQKRIRPVLIQDATTYFQKHGKSPYNAFLSVLFPGLGDHRVADPHNMIIRPCIRSAATIGLIGLGIVALDNREKTPAYRTYEPGFEQHPVFHPATTEYWAFPHDGEVFIGVGAAAWLADVFWVYSQGKINESMRKCFKDKSLTFSLTPQACYVRLAF